MKHRSIYAVAIGLLLLCLSMLLVVSRLPRRVPSQPLVLSGASFAEFTSLEPIDAHTHIGQTSPAFVAMLEHLHMHVLDILYVDDASAYRTSLDRQRQDALNFIAASKGYATLCTTFDPFPINSVNFSQNAIGALDEDFARGAVAAKVWKNIGMEIKNARGRFAMLDDPLFEPIYQDITARRKTLIIHAGAVDAAWQPDHPASPRSNYFEANPQWDMSKIPDAPQKKDILQARDHLLSMNPDLLVVGAHFGSMTEHLDELGTRLDRYPNFAVDTAARVQLLVTQPREKVRAFLLKYQDRILYGTDLRFESGNGDQVAREWEYLYALDWRYFATDDTFVYYGHPVEGLNLPHPVLKKLYHDNAVHWIPGIVPKPL